MSESSRTTADGGTSDTLNVEDLFATDDTDISIDDGESDDTTTTARTDERTPGSKPTTPGTGTTTPDAEDTTADELFAQLRDEHDDDEQAHAVDNVTDESPEDIMARADEDAEHVDQIDDSIRADEGALDDLLLTERREADGFLWVETENDDVDAPGDAVESLFEADANDDQRAESEQSTTNDDFSLADGTDDSFDAPAATFDADDFGANGTTPDDDASETTHLDESGDDDEPEELSDGTDDDSEGLAARIRSILTR
jgi:hypothetical protein